MKAGEVAARPAKNTPDAEDLSALQRRQLVLRIRLRIHLRMRLGYAAVLVDHVRDPLRVFVLR
jgi:hypothetical protein